MSSKLKIFLSGIIICIVAGFALNKDLILIDFLRNRVYSTIPQSNGATNIKKHIWPMGTNEMMSKFTELKGSLDCSGLSYILTRQYTDMGYESYQIHFGRPDRYTHVVTVVKIKENGKVKYIVEDPTYNVAYYSSNGLLDVRDMIKYARSNQLEKIYVRAVIEPHISLCTYEEVSKNLCEPALDHKKPFRLRGGIFAYYISSDIEGLRRSLNVFANPRMLTHGKDQKKTLQYHLKLVNNEIIEDEKK